MKRIVIIIFLILLFNPAFCQKLGYKTDNDKELSIGTNFSIENNFGIALHYNLNKTTKKDIWHVSFIVPDRRGPFSFDKGSELLIRTFKGTIIQLIEIKKWSDIKRDNTSITEYYAYPRYSISIEDLEKLIKEGAQKLRFDSTRGFIDLTFEKDYVGSVLADKKSIIIDESSFNRGF